MAHYYATLIQSVRIYYVPETDSFKLGCIPNTLDDYADYKGEFIRYSLIYFGPKPRKKIWRIGDKDVSYEEMLKTISLFSILENRKQTVLRCLNKAKKLAKNTEDLFSFRDTLEEECNCSHQIEDGNLQFELSNGCKLGITHNLDISIKDDWGVDVNQWLRNQPSLTSI